MGRRSYIYSRCNDAPWDPHGGAWSDEHPDFAPCSALHDDGCRAWEPRDGMKPHPHNTYGFEIKEEYDVDAHMWSPGYDGPALLCEDCARHGQRCGNPDVCDAWGTPDGPDPVIHEGTLVWHEGARLWICPECDEDCDTCSDCDTWHEKEFMTEVIWHPKAWPKGMNDSKWICKPCTAERVSQEE